MLSGMRTLRLFRWFAAGLLGLLAAGCSDTREEGGSSAGSISGSASASASAGTDSVTGGTGGGTAGSGGTGPKFDIGGAGSMGGGDDGGNCVPPGGDATLTGTVFAPNQVIPVSGALVYATDTVPTGIPQEVYCEECVELPCDSSFTLTNPDGTFSLSTSSGMRWLVVQKGQFLRATELTIAPGATALGPEVTSLPDHNDPAAGLYIPKIALALGSYDRLEDALAKLGLGDTIYDAGEAGDKLVTGTEQFDLWDNGTTLPGMEGDFADLLLDPVRMAEYHIIFVPCSDDAALGTLQSAAATANVRDWVAKGGKWYVADWSNEFIETPFTQYQDFYVDDFSNSADLFTEYDSLGTVLDADLLAWLQALPPGLKDINPQNVLGGHPTINNLPSIELVANWSGVMSTPPVMVPDGMGGMVDVGHYTWVEGPGDGATVPTSPANPMTITGQYGCGKIMFTTYHTAEGGAYVGLTPQELVLMYLILEIGVCQTPYEPPPPPG